MEQFTTAQLELMIEKMRGFSGKETIMICIMIRTEINSRGDV